MVSPPLAKRPWPSLPVAKVNKLALLGASGHGKVVADMAELLGWQHIDFFDDAWPRITQNGPWPVVGNTAALLAYLSEYQGVVVAIGNNAIRLAKLAELREKGASLVSLVHPAAVISRHASLEMGTVVMAGAVINTGSQVGEGCIINTNASVDHDCVLASGVHISPGASLAGGVMVGQGSWVGIGACVRQLVAIGQGVVVGAGAVVVTPVNDFQTVVGNPAKTITKNHQDNPC
ncbi:acetyltransferase [Zobellella sp. An-6]|uniref:acetyltransferase n=1 Tax=Zobellella sp. An-6 TaxID=3400218 RepID=UPI0040431CB8